MVEVKNGEVKFSSIKTSKSTKKLINTFTSHMKNLFKGVEEGHTYKLKICSGHFPMTVTLKGEELEVKNFIGEKVPRILKIKPGVKVTVNGSEIIVESINKDLAGQTAASIEQLTKRPGFDNRIFQDGIYIIEKDGVAIK